MSKEKKLVVYQNPFTGGYIELPGEPEHLSYNCKRDLKT
jgi:hypothetical protein